jgi:ATP-dependent protease ClpP protease subunit
MKEVLIDDYIGYDWLTDSGVTAKSVQKQLEGLEAGEEIKITVNSPGGSVYEGIVIFNLIRDYAKTNPVAVCINCMAMSMSAYIALAARTVNANAKVSVSDNSVIISGLIKISLENSSQSNSSLSLKYSKERFNNSIC